MHISIIYYLHQVPQSNASSVLSFYKEKYLPFLKFVKSNKYVTGNLLPSLSFLEWLDKENIESPYTDLKAFVDNGRLELASTFAYTRCVYNLSHDEILRQTLLNEAGLGYYLGRRYNFEGEPSLLVKNLDGFVNTDSCLSTEALNLLASLDYSWYAQKTSNKELLNAHHIYKSSNDHIKAVFIDAETSDLFSSSSLSSEVVTNYVNDYNFENYRILLIDLSSINVSMSIFLDSLDTFISSCIEKGITFTQVSDLISLYGTRKELKDKQLEKEVCQIKTLNENKFSSVSESASLISKAFNELDLLFINFFDSLSFNLDLKKYENVIGDIAPWDFNNISNSELIDAKGKNYLKSRLMVDKAINSDKYLFVKENGEVDKNFVKRSLELYVKAFQKIDNKSEDFSKSFYSLRDTIVKAVKS